MPLPQDQARNWAGNIAFSAEGLAQPQSVAEVQEAVTRAAKARAVGSRHSYNRIADSDGQQISLRRMNRVLGVDKAARTVTVEGGITYGELGPLLHAEGFGLRNLASLPHVTVAGATATATHGSGNGNQNLAMAVAGLEIVTASGDLLRVKRGDANFEGMVAHLGALGIVTAVTLDVVPTYEVRQQLYFDLDFNMALDNFEAISGAAYSVSLFTRWIGDGIDQVWVKDLADAPRRGGDFFGARPADRGMHPIGERDASPATLQMGAPGPWHERLPHFKYLPFPAFGDELQTEYFVARADAPAALAALKPLQAGIAPLLFISEIRTVAADQLWTSMNYQRDSVGIHFTWKFDWPGVKQVLPAIEAALAPFGVRPHWGKLFTMDKALIQSSYPKLNDFKALVRQHDPDGKFRNLFLEEALY